MIYWIGVTYIAGTAAGYLLGRGRTTEIISETIDNLVQNGYLKYKRDRDGDIDIQKWNSLD